MTFRRATWPAPRGFLIAAGARTSDVVLGSSEVKNRLIFTRMPTKDRLMVGDRRRRSRAAAVVPETLTFNQTGLKQTLIVSQRPPFRPAL